MGKKQRQLEVRDAGARYYPSNTLSLEQLSHWIAFSRVIGIGPARFKRLLDFFHDDAIAAWKAKSVDLAMAGIEPKVIERFQQQRAKIDPSHELDRLQKLRVQVITWKDDAYPPLLRQIEYAPPVLYTCGTITSNDLISSIGIVGTRKMSNYGRKVTEHFSSELVRASMTIVSGLAIGVDTIAHTTALDTGGRTIAVLACGLDVLYPRTNIPLAKRIVESGQGALVTSFPLGVNPEAGNFPARNHIISGLSLGILVTEAAEKSGAIITANSALNQGREVYAVPANIFSAGSGGVNKLIRDGAHPVTDVADILDHLNIHVVPTATDTQAIPRSSLWQPEVREPANPEERMILATLSEEPRHIDEIIRTTGLTTNTVNANLTIMELDGIIKQVKNMCYIRKDRSDS
jgi:DNA processing protein